MVRRILHGSFHRLFAASGSALGYLRDRGIGDCDQKGDGPVQAWVLRPSPPWILRWHCRSNRRNLYERGSIGLMTVCDSDCTEPGESPAIAVEHPVRRVGEPER